VGTPKQAADYGRLEVCKWLLDKGSDVNMQDKDGRTALMWAANTECAKLLLDKGASLDHTEGEGWTTLMFAALADKLDLAQLLLSRGARTDIVSVYPSLYVDFELLNGWMAYTNE
jgi:ankyrin repeat protein